MELWAYISSHSSPTDQQLPGRFAAMSARIAQTPLFHLVFLWNLPQKETFLLPATLLLYRKIYFCLEWSWWTNLAYSNKCLETVPRQHSPCMCHDGRSGGPGFYSHICLHTLCILCISPFCLRKVFLLANIFQRFYPFFSSPPSHLFCFPLSINFWDILLICFQMCQILPVWVHGWSVLWPQDRLSWPCIYIILFYF